MTRVPGCPRRARRGGVEILDRVQALSPDQTGDLVHVWGAPSNATAWVSESSEAARRCSGPDEGHVTRCLQVICAQGRHTGRRGGERWRRWRAPASTFITSSARGRSRRRARGRPRIAAGGSTSQSTPQRRCVRRHNRESIPRTTRASFPPLRASSVQLHLPPNVSIELIHPRAHSFPPHAG